MRIFEDEEKYIVYIDGFEVEGFICESFCKKCSHFQIYYERFDAYFCPQCNEWSEPKCGNPACEYCSQRPPQPLPIMM